MIKYKPQQYNDILDKLPQEVRDVVLSLDTSQHLWKIGEKRNLQIDQIGIMHDMAMDAMMGIVATKNLVGELEKELHVSALEASVIARDIDENIFKPIKQTMVTLYAGRAPNKPSSSLVSFYEEDESHPELKRDNLLKAIEDPTPAPVKVEVKKPIIQAPAAPKVTETHVTVYHNELQNKEVIKSTQPTPTAPKAIPVQTVVPTEQSIPKTTPSDFFHKMTESKLSQAMVMPKNFLELDEHGDVVGKPSAIPQVETKIEVEMPKAPLPEPPFGSTPKPEVVVQAAEAAAKRIDPYREPI